MLKRVAALVLVLAATASVRAQEPGQYRDFHLGTSLAAVSAITGSRGADVTLIHDRPALMQELRWIPSSFAPIGKLAPTRGAGLQQVVFSFYADQLSSMMIDYDRARTEGMTDADMIAALTAMYGAPVPIKSGVKDAVDRDYESLASRRVAQWVTADSSVTLSRWAYGAAFRLTVESTRLTALAHTADARALVLDAQDAPQREAARARQDEQDKRDALDKTRSANKATFQP